MKHKGTAHVTSPSLVHIIQGMHNNVRRDVLQSGTKIYGVMSLVAIRMAACNFDVAQRLELLSAWDFAESSNDAVSTGEVVLTHIKV